MRSGLFRICVDKSSEDAMALVWQWGEHRGPGMVAALSIGLVAAAAAAAAVGAPLVRCGTAWWISPVHR